MNGLVEDLHEILQDISKSFKKISQVKNNLLTRDLKTKSYYEKKWVFCKQGTKFEVSSLFLK